MEAVERVELRARVEGFLEQRLFEEGSTIRQGERLFVIEKTPYEVVVAQREADLAGAEAQLVNARADLERKRDLSRQKLLPDSDLDTAEASEAIADAAVLQARAALKRAQLDLGYTDILSPVDGKISRARYSVGNLVGPGSEPLAIVSSIDPIYVTIAVSEKDLIDARRNGIDFDNPRFSAHLELSDESVYEHPGRFEYLDTEVNQGTDTLLVRAEFPNPDGVLVPGQFVSVNVRQIKPISALVVPQAAVQRDQQGYFVLVVDRNDQVENRRIVVGDRVDTFWAVEQGLASGERVIVQGIQKVRPDMAVNPVLESP